MKLRTLDTDFRPAASRVEKALSVNIHASGEVSISTDLPGGTVSAEQNESDGTITISEVGVDGAVGETIQITVVAPPEE